MAEPFLSEIRLMSFGSEPEGWALCNGQLLLISENKALYSLIGTTFGGDGRVSFALPDLRGRAPMHAGAGHYRGERGGEQSHTLTVAELPAHQHHVRASTSATNGSATPNNNFLGGANNAYRALGPGLTSLNPETVQDAGGGQAHPNMQPFLTLSFCMALQGSFPSPN